MKTTLATLAVATFATLAISTPALASNDHAGHQAGMGNMHDDAGMMSEGTVKKLDAAAGKFTISHGPLANLDMPPMTMVFRASDPALLNGVKVGDRIRFKAERVGGAFTVTELEVAK